MPVYEARTPTGVYEFEAPYELDEEEYREYLRRKFTPEGDPIEEEELSALHSWGPTVLRGATGIASGIASAVPGPGTVIGGAVSGAGEHYAQEWELATGQREEYSPGVVALEAGLGAIPFGKAWKGATALRSALKTGAKRGLQTAGLAAVGGQGRSLIETGEFQPLEETAFEAGVGGVLGAAGGALEGRGAYRGAARAAAAERAAAEAAEHEAKVAEEIARREARIKEIEDQLLDIELKKPSVEVSPSVEKVSPYSLQEDKFFKGSFKIHHEGIDTELRLNTILEEDGKTLTISSIHSEGKTGFEKPERLLGIKNVRDLSRQLLEIYPEVEQLRFLRITGAKPDEGYRTITRAALLRKPTPKDLGSDAAYNALNYERAQLKGIDYEGRLPRVIDPQTGKPIPSVLDQYLQHTADAATQGKLTSELAEQGDYVLRKLKGRPTDELRLYQRVINELTSGDIEAPRFAKMLAEANMTMEGFLTDFVKPGVNEAGKTLNFYSQLQKKINKLSRNDTELRKALSAADLLEIPGHWDHIVNAFRFADDIRRAAMLSQPVTFIRNVITNTGRFGVDVLEEALMDFMNTSIGGRSANFYSPYTAAGRLKGAASIDHIVGLFRSFKPGETRRITQLLNTIDKTDSLSRRLFSNLTETGLAGKVGGFFTFFPKHTEMVYRRAKFVGKLNSLLKNRGLDPADVWKNPHKILDSELEDAIEESLRVTFQAEPATKTGRQFLHAWNMARPFSTAILPYPRYFANAMRFALEYNPVGFLKHAGMGGQEKAIKGASTLSRAMIGSVMWAWGISVRFGPNAAPRWMETLDPDTGKTIDINDVDTKIRSGKNWLGMAGPFAPYMFIGELFKQYAEKGSDTRLWNISTADWIQGVVGFQRVPPALNGLVDAFRADDLDSAKEVAARVIGDITSGLTVPGRPVKDFMAAILGQEEEAEFLDPREPIAESKVKAGFLAPSIQNIPGLAGSRPASISVTRGEERTSILKSGIETPLGELPGRLAPIFRQATGAIPVEKTSSEIAMEELGISAFDLRAKTGNPEANREIDRRFGRIWNPVMNDVTDSEWWDGLDQISQEMFMKWFAEAIRAKARDDFEEDMPGLAAGISIESTFTDVEKEWLKRHADFDIDGLVNELIKGIGGER